ncbi:MAG: 50S ribosomal protein L20 [Patescibacteria group bacterium]|nr:50S ribosomal protein L20 [Patescibacteria group bacterium]
MARSKTGTVRRKKHKKVLKRAKGFKGTNSRLFKRAHEAVLHAGQYAYNGRKLRKRDMRKLWIMRINAALKSIEAPVNYSRFIHQLKENEVKINRKMLAEMAVNDLDAFKQVVELVTK